MNINEAGHQPHGWHGLEGNQWIKRDTPTKTSSLVDLIQKQYSYLKKVPDEKIKAIIEGNTGHKIALLLGGYDKYKRGANEDIDRVIEMPDINTFVILTSLPGYVGKELKNEMDGEVVIEGFTEENRERCSEKYLGSKEKLSVMLKQAEEAGIYKNKSESNDSLSLLRAPIVLLMICVIFEERNSLPK